MRDEGGKGYSLAICYESSFPILKLVALIVTRVLGVHLMQVPPELLW